MRRWCGPPKEVWPCGVSVLSVFKASVAEVSFFFPAGNRLIRTRPFFLDNMHTFKERLLLFRGDTTVKGDMLKSSQCMGRKPAENFVFFFSFAWHVQPV